MIYIGIDTGVNTGIAVWDSEKKEFITVGSQTIHEALFEVNRYDLMQKIRSDKPSSIKVRVEDARQRKYITGGREKLQGAGSVKRDAKIWEDFLSDYNIPYEMVAPKYNKTKLTAEAFKKLTGWEAKTNSHGRDAAMLIFNL
jgi:hypothetical protein